jgi:hypothetical protein
VLSLRRVNNRSTLVAQRLIVERYFLRGMLRTN